MGRLRTNDQVSIKTLSATERLLHASALVAAAVAQPLFDLLATHAEMLVAHDLRPWELVALALGLGVILPLAWGLCVLAVGLLGCRAGAWAYGCGITVPGAMLALILLEKFLPLAAWLLVGLAIVAGAVLAWGALRRPELRVFLTVTASGLVVFPLFFLLRTPVSSLVFLRTVAATGPAIPATAPVVLVIFDELPLATLLGPDGGMDQHRFPHFAALAAEAHWYARTTTVAESTTYAVPAILTGRYPDRERLALAAAYPESLFTWLGGRYDMNVFEAITKLCPDTVCGGAEREGTATATARLAAVVRDLEVVYLHVLLPEALRRGLPAVTETWRDFQQRGSATGEGESASWAAAGDVRRLFEQFLANVRYEVRPVLHLIHLNLPHLPWKYLPTGQEYGPLGGRLRPPGLSGERWSGDAWLTALGWQRHILQAMYADRLLGRLVERLRQTRLYDRALVIVVADHGASFQSGLSRRRVAAANSADILAIPLLIKLPGQRQGERSERVAETVDVLPTIADVLDSPLPWAVHGRSLLTASAEERQRVLVVEREGERQRREVTLDPAAIEATRTRMASIFGRGDDPLDLYRLGPFGAMVGRRVTSFPLTTASSLEVRLRDAWTYAAVDRTSSFLPAYVTGSVAFGERPSRRLPLAVAVNGTIQAVGRTFEQPTDRWDFAGMVPASAFRDGLNQLDFYEVVGSPAAPQLSSVRRRDSSHYTLRLDAKGAPTGLEIFGERTFLPLVPGAVAGHGVMNGVMIRGWAADAETGEPASTVLLFAAERFLAAAPVGLATPARSNREDGGSIPPNAGFEVVIPYGAMADQDAALQLFAVAGERVSVLSYHDPRQRRETSTESAQ